MQAAELEKKVRERFPDEEIRAEIFRGDLALSIRPSALLPVARFLRDDQLNFDYIVHVSSIDWLSAGAPWENGPRFEVVYEFYSISRRHRIRIKTRIPEEACEVDSLTPLWKGANFMEREVYDMMGIRFVGHPDLRRVLLPDDYDEGYPLRKNFPVEGRGWRDRFEFMETSGT